MSVQGEVVAELVAWIQHMMSELSALPLDDEAGFVADARNSAAAESYLRRALEGLLDLGWHIVAEGFGRAVQEDRGMAFELGRVGVLSEGEVGVFRDLTVYRNRMVDSYRDIEAEEILETARDAGPAVQRVLEALLRWADRIR